MRVVLSNSVRKMSPDPMLYALVFGESVLNDAVSIVLFRYRTCKDCWPDLHAQTLTSIRHVLA